MFQGADQHCTVGLLSKMAVDRLDSFFMQKYSHLAPTLFPPPSSFCTILMTGHWTQALLMPEKLSSTCASMRLSGGNWWAVESWFLWIVLKLAIHLAGLWDENAAMSCLIVPIICRFNASTNLGCCPPPPPSSFSPSLFSQPSSRQLSGVFQNHLCIVASIWLFWQFSAWPEAGRAKRSADPDEVFAHCQRHTDPLSWYVQVIQVKLRMCVHYTVNWIYLK